MSTQRICMACDLKDDPAIIQEYKNHHLAENVWPEITESITAAGIQDMQIYLVGNRLFMIMEVDENFDSERKTKMDMENPKVQEWESLMMNYQQFLPFANVDAKWVQMEQIFQL